MELSIRSLKTSIPSNIKDINAILLVITADPGLHALDIIAVESEFTLPTIGPHRATDSEVIRVGSTRQVGASGVVHNITHPINCLLGLVGAHRVLRAIVPVFGPDTNQ